MAVLLICRLNFCRSVVIATTIMLSHFQVAIAVSADLDNGY